MSTDDRLVTSQGSVAVVRGGALGDFVLTLPLIHALQVGFSDNRLILVGNPATTRLAGKATHISDQSGLWAHMFTPVGPSPKLLDQFSDCRLLIACVAGGIDAAPACYLENLHRLCPQVVVGDTRPEPGQKRHMAARLLDPLRATNVAVPPIPQPRIPLRGEKPRGNLIILHPGSGGRDKCWPADRFSQLLNWLEQTGNRVAVLWGPVEQSRARDFPQALATAASLLRPESPSDLACQLSGARLYIGNDTGPGHVAAAVGCPSLSVFGPTDPDLWRPLGEAARVLRAPAGNLQHLTTKTVIESVEGLL
jgi:heptosyltransferase-3